MVGLNDTRIKHKNTANNACYQGLAVLPHVPETPKKMQKNFGVISCQFLGLEWNFVQVYY